MKKRIRNSITEQQKLNIVPEFWVVAFYVYTLWECAACIDPGLNASTTLYGVDSLWMPNSISPPNNDKTDLHLETYHLFRMRMDCGTILAIRSGLKRFKWNIQWMSVRACVYLCMKGARKSFHWKHPIDFDEFKDVGCFTEYTFPSHWLTVELPHSK